MRFCLPHDASDDLTGVDADSEAQVVTEAQSVARSESKNITGKVCDPDRVVTSKKSGLNVPLTRFQTTASHVGFADSLNFLKPMLLTKGVKAIIDAVK